LLSLAQPPILPTGEVGPHQAWESVGCGFGCVLPALGQLFYGKPGSVQSGSNQLAAIVVRIPSCDGPLNCLRASSARCCNASAAPSGNMLTLLRRSMPLTSSLYDCSRHSRSRAHQAVRAARRRASVSCDGSSPKPTRHVFVSKCGLRLRGLFYLTLRPFRCTMA
jgi:hypothetical protein